MSNLELVGLSGKHEGRLLQPKGNVTLQEHLASLSNRSNILINGDRFTNQEVKSGDKLEIGGHNFLIVKRSPSQHIVLALNGENAGRTSKLMRGKRIRLRGEGNHSAILEATEKGVNVLQEQGEVSTSGLIPNIKLHGKKIRIGDTKYVLISKSAPNLEPTVIRRTKKERAQLPRKEGKTIVFGFNYQPSEFPIVGLHARRIAKILEDEYGHKVIFRKVPYTDTHMGIVNARINGKYIYTPHEAVQRLRQRGIQEKEIHSDAVFTFLGFQLNPPSIRGIPTKPEEVIIRDQTPGAQDNPQLRSGKKEHGWVIRSPMPRGFHVVIPCVGIPLPERKSLKLRERIETLRAVKGAKWLNGLNEEDYERQINIAAVNRPEQAVFLDQSISHRYAKLIHKILSRAHIDN